MEENKKSKLGLGILIGVLVTLVLCMGVFIVYDKFLTKGNNDSNNEQLENNNTENEEIDSDNKQQVDEVVEISINDDLVKKLYQMSGGEIQTTDFNLFSSDKLLIKDLDIYNMENLLYLQLSRESADDIVIQNSNEYLKWNGSTIKSLWAKLFGSNTTFKLANKTVNGATYQNDGSLTLPAASGRFEGPSVYPSQLLKATKSDSEIVLYVAVKFIDFDSGKCYSDVNMTQLTTKEASIPANYKKVFKKDMNGNYYFYSVEKIK